MEEKEFLKLENRLILKLKIKPISPLIIKMGDGKEKDDSESVITFMTSESPQISKNGKGITGYNKETKKINEDGREGEPFILGSTLRGLFRERFCQIYGIEGNLEDYDKKTTIESSNNDSENAENEKQNDLESKENIKLIKKLFGYTDVNDALKGRIFLEDAYLENEEYRKAFYKKDNGLEIKRKLFKTRSITPIDAFTGKAVVPLTVEYLEEYFLTTLIINNITKEELKNIYFVIRDSLLGEIRIGSSKTRGFGQIEFHIEDFIFEKYATNNDDEEYKYIEELREFFVSNDTSIKIGDKYLRENLEFKDEKYKKVDVENPNEFIKKLFGEE